MFADGLLEGSYEVMEQLGEGGFGIVHKAKQRTTGQLVAIKTVRLPSDKDPTTVDKLFSRFLRETKLCARLYHPNIVQVINAGKTDEGLLYTVFSFAPGKSLADLIAEEGALNPWETQYLMLQVLDALACAHAQGIVHRDLKPSNIMVIPTGARRNALVLDFGISTLVKSVQSEEYSRLTGTAELVGTPGYAAPEQLRGDDSSPATDLFSWGLVFLECLTGEPVYRGRSVPDILYQQLGPEPISIPEPLQGHPLGALLSDVTQKDIETRTKNATKLLTLLDACDLRGLAREMFVDSAPTGNATRGRAAVSFRFANTALLSRIGESTASAITGERRQVTALCCNLRLREHTDETTTPVTGGGVGDIEEHCVRLRELFGICVQVAQQHHGSLVAMLGEQALFFFGFPHADEHDAKRAARAALAIEAAMAAEGERLGGQRMDLMARIGIHTGLVVIPKIDEANDADLTVGVTPQIVAQIASTKFTSGILVSSATRGVLRASFAFQAVGSLDNSRESIRIFRLREQEQESTTASDDQDDAQPLALIGRERESDLLFERWNRASQGTGQCCLLTGEPGIGKSRLADEVRKRIRRQPHTFLDCRCTPEARNSPLFPVIDLIKRLLTRQSSHGDQASHLEALLSRYGFNLAENMPLMETLLGMPVDARFPPLNVSPERQKQLTLEALEALFFAMAEERPVFLLVEDLHWADPTTLELLVSLVNEVSGASLCALFTARPEFSPSMFTSGILQLSLNRLGSYEIEALVAELADGRDMPQDILRQVVQRTDGVPLFVEEFTQMLVESGVLIVEDDAYVLGRPLSPAEIPLSLRDLLTSRLDRLGRAKDTAQLASVVGREFGLQLLSAASELDASELEVHLDKLQKAGLIQKKRSRGDQRYLFKHALIRDAGYESLTKSARQVLHGQIARTLEEHFPESARRIPAELARHHAGAADFESAVRYGTDAAQSFLDRSNNDEAMAQTSQVSAWLNELSKDIRGSVELRIKGIEVEALSSKEGWASENVRDLAENSRELLLQSEDTQHTMSILFALFTHYHVASARSACSKVADELVALADRLEDESLQVVAATAKGVNYHAEGRFLEAKRWLEKACTHYDPERDRQHGQVHTLDCRVWAMAQLAWVEWGMGRTTRSFQLANEAIEWARKIEHIPSLGIGLLYISQIHQMNNDRAAVLRTTRELLNASTAYGLPAFEGYAAAIASWAAGHLEGVRTIIDTLESLNCHLILTYYGSYLADIEADAGNIPQALAHVETYLKKCSNFGEYVFEVELLRRRALYEMRRPEPDLDIVRDSLNQARLRARERGMYRFESAAISDYLQFFDDGQELSDRLIEIRDAFPDLKLFIATQQGPTHEQRSRRPPTP